MIETVLIEIAPVSLLSSVVFGHELELFDSIGAVGLIPLTFLLMIDFNTHGANPHQTNIQLLWQSIINVVQFFQKNLESLSIVIAVCVIFLRLK